MLPTSNSPLFHPFPVTPHPPVTPYIRVTIIYMTQSLNIPWLWLSVVTLSTVQSLSVFFHSFSLMQFNNNRISEWNDVQQLAQLKSLETVYLEHNPIWQDKSAPGREDANYRRKIMLMVPWVKQIDATYVR